MRNEGLRSEEFTWRRSLSTEFLTPHSAFLVTLFSHRAAHPRPPRLRLHENDAGPTLLGRVRARGRAAAARAAWRTGRAPRLSPSADARAGRAVRADLLRPAGRRAVEDRGSFADHVGDARLRPRSRRTRARGRAPVDRRLFLGRAADAVVLGGVLRAEGGRAASGASRPHRSRSGDAPLSRALRGEFRRAAGERLGAAAPGGAGAVGAARARSARLPPARVRAFRRGVLRRPSARPGPDPVPRHRSCPTASLGKSW